MKKAKITVKLHCCVDPFSLLRQEGFLSGKVIQAFQGTFGDIFFKSLEFLEHKNPKVTKITFSPSHLEQWLVQGSKRPYLVYPDRYCQCQDFIVHVMFGDRVVPFCKHILAQKIAGITNQYVTSEILDKDYSTWKRNLKYTDNFR